jgi:hypothetical protein
MKKLLLPAIATLLTASAASAIDPEATTLPLMPSEMQLDSLLHQSLVVIPTFATEEEIHSIRLTEKDYREVAAELGVEVAAIKAVVDIETGSQHSGFWADGKPLINFDLSIYRQMAPRHGVNLADARRRAPIAFRQPDARRYGSRQAAQQARLDAIAQVNEEAAYESVFWGMFQIGGFNWKKCKTESIYDFVKRMSRSERDQLELFAAFCRSNDLIKYIKAKNWAAFSLRYNGPGYRKHNYHNKMAAAYQKFKRQEK